MPACVHIAHYLAEDKEKQTSSPTSVSCTKTASLSEYYSCENITSWRGLPLHQATTEALPLTFQTINSITRIDRFPALRKSRDKRNRRKKPHVTSVAIFTNIGLSGPVGQQR